MYTIYIGWHDYHNTTLVKELVISPRYFGLLKVFWWKKNCFFLMPAGAPLYAPFNTM